MSLSLRTEASAWTGGQYSLFRVLFGSYLSAHFLGLLPYAVELFSNRGMLPEASLSPFAFLFPNILSVLDGPGFVAAFVGLGAVLSVLLALGFRDRWAALGLWYIWACLFGRNPLISNPGLPYVGLLLVVHALLPRAPYGSLEARGRADPRGVWHMQAGLYTVVWALMALGYSYSGYTKLVSPSWLDGSALARVLQNPLARPTGLRNLLLGAPAPLIKALTWGALALELLFAPLALSQRLRPWIWAALLGMHLGLVCLIDFADLSLGMMMLHLFTFSPSWVPPLTAKARVFYDGDCGLCHRAVRFALAEDRSTRLSFTPLSEAGHTLSEEQLRDLPDSMVLLREDGALFTRSGAVLLMLGQMGGAWRLLGALLRPIPRLLRDKLYDSIARNRKRIFDRPSEVCPVVPPDLRKRFKRS